MDGTPGGGFFQDPRSLPASALTCRMRRSLQWRCAAAALRCRRAYTHEQLLAAILSIKGGGEMLKDITLGQFFPGNTIAHRLDPRTKLILVVVYIVRCSRPRAGYPHRRHRGDRRVHGGIEDKAGQHLQRAQANAVHNRADGAAQHLLYRGHTCAPRLDRDMGRASRARSRWCCASSCSLPEPFC